MAFDLPRSPRSIRFTGSVRAISNDEAEEAPAPFALGRARPNAGPPIAQRSLPLAAPPRSMRGAPPVPVNRVTTPTRLTTMRGSLVSIDEDVITQCLDRDALEIAQLPDARRGKSPPSDLRTGAPNLPVPHFRSREEVAQHHHEPTIVVRPSAKSGTLPLGVWLFAAMIAGVVSFHFAPQARESFQEALRAFDSH